MIIEQLVVSPFAANCYVIGCEKSKVGAVIDPGDEAGRILQTIERLNLNIAYILLTHAHIDHIGAAKEVADATQAPLALHKADLPLLQAGGGGPLFGLPAPPRKEPDLWLEEGQTIAMGNYPLEVLFTPGHSPGHVCFYQPRAGVLFDGDVLFQGSIGRTDLPGGSYETLMHSINEKLMTLPDETIVCSGHGPRTTIGKERTNNPFL